MSKSQQSLASLRKVKPDIQKILVETTNLVVYKFDSGKSKWDRYGVEGGAFLVQAESAPQHMLIVLNRAGPENFVLDLSTIVKMKPQEPYIMLRCSTSASPSIYGLWLHDKDERDKMASCLEGCMKLTIKPQPEAPAPVSSLPSVSSENNSLAPKIVKLKNPFATPVASSPAPVTSSPAPVAETSAPPTGTKIQSSIQRRSPQSKKEVSGQVLTISDVTSRLISPSDVTGKVRKFALLVS